MAPERGLGLGRQAQQPLGVVKEQPAFGGKHELASLAVEELGA
jgi:hypothetical protein